MSDDKSMTWESAVLWLRSQSHMQDLVESCYYDEPLGLAAERYALSEEWEALCSMLKGWMPGKVLDVGAGNGISSYAFARSGNQVTALEPDPSPIVGMAAVRQLAQQNCLPIEGVQAFGEQLPFDDAHFDIVHGRQVLHHAQDLERLCAEMARVLRPSGVFVATREHVISRECDREVFLASHPLHGFYGGENAFLLDRYRRAIGGAGLKLIRVLGSYDSPINYYPVTKAQNTARIARVLRQYLGRSVAERLAGSETLQTMVGRLRSRLDGTPGRLYSFIAVK